MCRGLDSSSEMQDSFADAFCKSNVVAFARNRNDRRPKPDFEVEGLIADKRSRRGLQHVERAPMTRQAVDMKRHNRRAGLACRYGCARVPGTLHVRFKIAVRETRRKNSEDGLLPAESLRVLQKFDHSARGHTLLNGEDDSVAIAHEAKEMF